MSKEEFVSQMLQTFKSTTNKSNLYHHLNDIIDQIQVSSQLNHFRQFQRLSEYVKNTKFHSEQPKSEDDIKTECQKSIQYPEWIDREQQIINQSKQIKQTQKRIIQNFQKANNLLREVGIDFGSEASFKLNCVLKKLSDKWDATHLRFWGKILGVFSDYYVIQGICNKKNMNEVQGMEKYREGVNYYSYWVNCNLVSDDWVQLPSITAEQMVASRKIKYIMKGNLNNYINSYPSFPGQQKHLLKAQLVRITHNCQICPKGMYSPLQDNPDQIDFTEDWKYPQFGELSSLQNWIHINPYILNMGRSSYYVSPKIPQQQKEEMLTKWGETDPKVQRLKAINQDKVAQKMGFEGCWMIKIHGNTQLFNNVGKEEGSSSCYGVISLRNANWAGWTTVSNMRMFTSCYIGYGFKATQQPFSPLSPNDLLLEGQDNDEFDQPNPRNPPDELQPDSDDENKKQQQ